MRRIDEDIKNNKLKKVYLLYGEEAYLKKQYKEKLIKALVPEGDSMNYTVFNSDNFDYHEMIQLSETMPFLAEHRVILIEDSGLFKKSEDDVAEYIEQIPDASILIWVENEVDKRNRLYKAVDKNGLAVEFAEQNDKVLEKWISIRLKKDNKRITREAFLLFIQRVGTDMENIDKELEKLVCYTYDKDIIEKADVEEITTEQVSNKVFEMVDAIALKKPQKAIELYNDLLFLKEPSMRILFLISRQFHILEIVKAMTNQGFGAADISKYASCPSWAVKKNQNQAKSFTLDQLKDAVRYGVELEELVKTGQLNAQIAVELFIVKYSNIKNN
ncbi:DNA polymerase III subunit delta [Lachnobacterium bovis]|uniref:DNA polymerase III subunit delta n=1 Tax=Lachnobacterium bovis TaxID=140626 RepID=UPI0003B6BDC5|nr:DNA polymerase III subunit delta [Lachnobacterium bovis]